MTEAAVAPDAPKDAGRPPVLNTPQPWFIRLIDRRTGRTHRLNGSPLMIVSKTPALAAAELLQGRDASIWEARVEPLTTRDVRTSGLA